MADTYTASFRAKGAVVTSTGRASPPVDRPEPGRASFDAFLRAAERLEQAIDQETAVLRQHKAADLADFNHRKSHGLLELTRAVRGLARQPADGPVAARLRALRAKLEMNRSMLETHLRAVQEIAAIMSGAMRDADSDGTYTAALRFGSGAR